MTDKKKKADPDESTDVVINPDEFSIGDLEDYEDATGFNLINVVQQMGEDRPGGPVMPHPRAMRGLVWLVRRRSEDVTFESLREMKLSEMNDALRGTSAPSA